MSPMSRPSSCVRVTSWTPLHDIALAVSPTLVLPFGLLIHIGYSFCG